MKLSIQRRCAMLASNTIPLLHVAGSLALALSPWTGCGWRVVAAVIWFYLAPPLAARLVRAVWKVREGHIGKDSPEFLAWWILFNLQVVFCRFPVFEELLRLVPGLYSAWLRLWGSQIGRLTYWAAGTLILDRSFLRIGDDVIFGTGVRLNPHVLAKNDTKDMELVLATVVIGHRAVIGGYSLLTAGTEIADDECTRAFTISPPFSRWQDGRRVARMAVEA